MCSCMLICYTLHVVADNQEEPTGLKGTWGEKLNLVLPLPPFPCSQTCDVETKEKVIEFNEPAPG